MVPLPVWLTLVLAACATVVLWSLAAQQRQPYSTWTKSDEEQGCPWNGRRFPMHPARLHKSLVTLLRIVGELPFRTALIDGSLLGAFRNRGLIPGDNDVDLCLYLNESRAQLKNESSPKGGLRLFENKPTSERTTRFLPLVDAFVAAMAAHPLWPRAAVDILRHHDFGFHVILHGPSIFLDIILAGRMPVEAGGVCRCIFSGVKVNCLANTESLIIRSYGPNYTRPESKHNWNGLMYPE